MVDLKRDHDVLQGGQKGDQVVVLKDEVELFTPQPL